LSLAVYGFCQQLVTQPQPHAIAITGNNVGDYCAETATAEHGDVTGIGHWLYSFGVFIVCSEV
jgi:hypothetical protein